MQENYKNIHICVSDTVYEVLKDDLVNFRSIDRVLKIKSIH